MRKRCAHACGHLACSRHQARASAVRRPEWLMPDPRPLILNGQASSPAHRALRCLAHTWHMLVCSRPAAGLWYLSSSETPRQGRPPGALMPSPVPGMSRRRSEREGPGVFAFCGRYQGRSKVQGWAEGQWVEGGTELCSSAPEPGNPSMPHPATPTAGRNSIAGEEVWERGQRAPPTTTWQPSELQVLSRGRDSLAGPL